jgi:NAD(P)-dependent dehydrogenase (short-subunit alcohol dehydrogenase family)
MAHAEVRGVTDPDRSATRALPALSLAGKRALVTGSGTGLGKMIALGLAQGGADIVVVGRRRDKLEDTAAKARAIGADVTIVTADITDEADVVRLGAEAGQVDILVNNVGIAPNQHWTDVPLGQWREVFAVNVDAPFRLCQLLAPGMMERGWGRIINIASVYGRQGGNPALYEPLDWDVPSYFASKHAIHGVTHYLAGRLAPHGVTINDISPGGFTGSEQNEKSQPATDERSKRFFAIVPAGRIGDTDDIQAAVVFLASPGAAYITGQDIVIDGGWTIW